MTLPYMAEGDHKAENQDDGHAKIPEVVILGRLGPHVTPKQQMSGKKCLNFGKLNLNFGKC